MYPSVPIKLLVIKFLTWEFFYQCLTLHRVLASSFSWGGFRHFLHTHTRARVQKVGTSLLIYTKPCTLHMHFHVNFEIQPLLDVAPPQILLLNYYEEVSQTT